jgi:hypothetical protein
MPNFGPVGPQLPQGYVPKPPQTKQQQRAAANAAKETKRLEKEKFRYPKQSSVAQGFGKITSQINSTIRKIREKVNDVYYGKNPVNSGSRHVNPLDYGLINVLNLLLDIDVCSIFSYGLNKLPGTPPFDPKNKDQASKTTLGKIKWEVQNAAFQIKKTIDQYYTEYADVNSKDTKLGLFTLIQQVNNQISSAKELLYSEPLLNSYPELNVMNNFLDNAQKYFAKYTDINNLNDNNVQEILSFVNRTKTICSSIIALNNPTAALQFIDSTFGTSLSEQIKKLDKVLNPKNLPKAIKNLTDVGEKIQNASNQILQYINYGRFIIAIATVLIVIFKIINKFLKVLGVPNIFTFLGLSTTMSEANGMVIDRADYFMKRLSEINSVLNSIYNLCQDLTIKIETIISGFKQLLQNILDCQEDETSGLYNSVNDIKTLIAKLENTRDQLVEFTTTYDNNKKKSRNTFGNYTIAILSEELVDEGIKRKRRYGVAQDSNGVVVVKGTPTFASDDIVIIEEVKLLLISKKLIQNVAASAASISELKIMEESLSYLSDTDISLDALDISFDTVIDDPDNEDEDEDEVGPDGLNLNAFVSKLKGGKKLRRKMRLKMARQKIELADQLSKTPQSGKFTSKIVTKKKKEAYNDAIKGKETEIEIYNDAIKKYLILMAAAGPLMIPFWIRLIKKKKDQIKACQKVIADYQRQIASLK